MRMFVTLFLATASLGSCIDVTHSRMQTSVAARPATQASTRPERPDQSPVLAPNSVAVRDIAFGADKKFQSLDVYVPKNAKDAPVVIFLHGGGWTRSDKTD